MIPSASTAHIGWLLFKLWAQRPFDNVADLKKDPLVMWQHRLARHSLTSPPGSGDNTAR